MQSFFPLEFRTEATNIMSGPKSKVKFLICLVLAISNHFFFPQSLRPETKRKTTRMTAVNNLVSPTHKVSDLFALITTYSDLAAIIPTGFRV
jgi:hypothetical protein